MDNRPDIVSRGKSSSHPLKPGRFYTGTVTELLPNGKINIKISELGSRYYSIMPLNTTSNSRYVVGDSVKCGFSDEFFNELIVFGSTRVKEDVFAARENGIERYASSSSRDEDITSPSEGQVVYLLDTDELQIYNGTEWITVIDTGNSENITASTIAVGTLTVSTSATIGDVSATEINYLNGVTSNIQTQIDSKAPSASPSFTGVPLAPTASAGTNTTQLATTAFVGAAVSVGMPTGAIIPFAGSTAPTGWLLCDGGSTGLLRTTYAALFAVIGTTYGSGDGSTTFNVPDLRGRVVAGKDNMGGVAANRITSAISGVTGTTLGAVGGSQSLTSHNHTQNSHNHTQDSHNHTQNSHNHTQNGHAHSNSLNGTTTFAADGHTHAGQGTLAAAVGATNDSTNRIGHIAGSVISGASTYSLQGTSALTGQSFNHNSPVYGSTGGNNVSATVGINNTSTETATNIATIATNIATTATNQVTTATNNSTGAGSSENVQPTIILNYIIKA